MRARRGIALAALAASALSLQGCLPIAAIGAAGTAVVMMEDRRTSGTQIEDQGIEIRTAARINERFGSVAHINVNAFNRAVLLSGEAPDARVKAEIESIAAAVQNVRRVTNEIEIGNPSARGARSNDAFITGKVQGRFLDGGKFNPLHVKVVTEGSVVYLMGIVTEQEAADAVEIARTTAGVRKVVKIFEYCQPTEEICRPPQKPSRQATRPPG